MGLNFELKSHKAANFMKIVLAVCRLARCEENKREERKKMFLKAPDIKEYSAINL